jgi:diamine N-acetyltransferase
MLGSAGQVTLREITAANRSDVEALSVTDEQSAYVEGVAGSLVEAAQTPDARPWFRAVYRGATPVGFVMLSDGITVADPAYIGRTSSGGC